MSTNVHRGWPPRATSRTWLAFALAATALIAFMPSVALASEGETTVLPAVWAVAPFILLLAMIATGPLFYHHFWERYYPHVSIGFGLVVIAYYGIGLHEIMPIYHELEEYISFLALLAALFVASGTILIDIDKKGTPFVNVAILFFGCILANIIGTTGASMLLIRPLLRVNRGRLRPYHVIFLIFLVSNVGGALTPVGDPPLFMGFLRGVPFFWVVSHVFWVWLMAVAIILAVFFAIDVRNKGGEESAEIEYSGHIRLRGASGFIWVGVIIAAVFLDPNVIPGFPSLQDLLHVPFGIREVIMFLVCIFAYKTADKQALKGNDFNFEPIKEVGFLFIGIFMTMVPALELIAHEAEALSNMLTPGMFYFGTGSLSSVLDNTPTYLNFFAGALGKYGLDPSNLQHVRLFAACSETTKYLEAISMGAVFFGAMTYIGNAPNFMVKSISDQAGVECPSFFGYVFKWSLPILLPVFIIVWLVFFMEPANHAVLQVNCPQIWELMHRAMGH